MGYPMISSTDAPLLGEPLPVELMNSLWGDKHGVHDALRGQDGSRSWLLAASLRIAPMTASDLEALTMFDIRRLGDQVVGLRDALRRLAVEITDDPRATDASNMSDLRTAVTVLNETAAYAPSWSRLSWVPNGEPSRQSLSDSLTPFAALSAIAEEAISFFSGDARHKLRACLAPRCLRYFVKDHPRREWCSAACGNRARTARHYQRHRMAVDLHDNGRTHRTIRKSIR
jgi:predicted RNA-binding Zn ribbon-like protein